MNVSLVASCVVGGLVVTNERGLFVPLSHGMSETARAFAVMFTQSHLLPDNTDLTDVRMVTPLSPFEVTADSRDLRRRLMDASQEASNEAGNAARELSYVDPSTLTTTDAYAGTPADGTSGSGTSGNGSSGNGNSGGNAGNGGGGNHGNPAFSSPDVTQNQIQPQALIPTSAVPEPASWAMLIAGFGFVGYFLRTSRRRRADAAEALDANG